MKQYLILFFYFLIAISTIAQETITRFNTIQNNFLYHNPAYVFDENQPVSISSFSQIHSTGHTQLLSLNYGRQFHPNKHNYQGIGFYAKQQNIGHQQSLDIKLSFTFQQYLKTGGTLGIGIRSGYTDHKNNISQEKTVSQQNITLGLWYHTVNYYGGISIINTSSSQQISAILGYNYRINRSITIIPVILSNSNFTHTNIDFEIITSINNYTWGGMAFRQSMKYDLFTSNDLVVLLGMGFLRRMNSESGKITKPLKVSYSFTLPITNTPTTFHELSISYVIPIGKRNPPPLPPLRSGRRRYSHHYSRSSHLICTRPRHE